MLRPYDFPHSTLPASSYNHYTIKCLAYLLPPPLPSTSSVPVT